MSKNTDQLALFSSNDIAKLVQDLQQMEACAWDRLQKLYAVKLDRDIVVSLRKRGLSSDTAEDIAQETWLTAVQHIGEYVYQGQNQLYHWLRAISLNHIRNLKARQRPTLSLEAIQAAHPRNSNAVDQFLAKHRLGGPSLLEEEVVMREQLGLLDEALQDLKPSERDIVFRRFVWHEKPEQLAVLYAPLKPRSISQMLCRFKNRLQCQASGFR